MTRSSGVVCQGVYQTLPSKEEEKPLPTQIYEILRSQLQIGTRMFHVIEAYFFQ